MDNLALTKKAERYASEMTTTVDTADKSNGSVGLLTIQIDRTSRKALATSIEVLIDMLDDLSPDPDLEDTADDEPWLGWGGRGLPTVSWPADGRGSPHDDRELDDSDAEDGADDEHDLGWQDEGPQDRLSWSQRETDLGPTEEIDQVRRLETAEGWLCEDGEEDINDMPHDGDEREQPDHY